MNVIKTSIPGVLIIEPRVFKDSRGYFFESFSQREFDENRRTKQEQSQASLSYALGGGGRPKIKR